MNTSVATLTIAVVAGRPAEAGANICKARSLIELYLTIAETWRPQLHDLAAACHGVLQREFDDRPPHA